jgi:hypothetical protein
MAAENMLQLELLQSENVALHFLCLSMTPVKFDQPLLLRYILALLN